MGEEVKLTIDGEVDSWLVMSKDPFVKGQLLAKYSDMEGRSHSLYAPISGLVKSIINDRGRPTRNRFVSILMSQEDTFCLREGTKLSQARGHSERLSSRHLFREYVCHLWK